ncbi:SigE family RNA polymerase sigma factor [Asanoa sp. NPDC049573]|uniref:SigE family RNA polymerase sigma factor n=1 Tax=Asanoa sp. NPDC049573 TaxID=3155396 RepID=UPI0034255F7B
MSAVDHGGVVPDKPDFAEFYAAWFRPLTHQLFAHTGDLAEAQDVVQEAFCRAWPRWSTLDDPGAWVRRVAWNLATSRWRRARRLLHLTRGAREEHSPGPGPDRVALRAALASLPERQRQAVVLFYLADVSIAEIAELTGAAEGTVKSWLHRGRAALALRLADDDVTTGQEVRSA